jgi:hypothetical protein
MTEVDRVLIKDFSLRTALIAAMFTGVILEHVFLMLAKILTVAAAQHVDGAERRFEVPGQMVVRVTAKVLPV